MVKKKSNTSLFTTLAQQINFETSSSSSSLPVAECHLIDNEYFTAFNSLEDIEKFHQKLIEKQSITNEHEQVEEEEEEEDHEMDMKTFAQQYLIDLPEPITTMNTKESISINTTSSSSKRQRRNIRDLPQSTNFVFMSDDDNHENIFEGLNEKKSSSRSKRIAYEDMSSILLTLDIKQKKKKHLTKTNYSEPTIGIELAEPSLIKTEPIEQEQLVITHVIEAKDEPIELNVIPTGPMGFGTAEYLGDLDNYVQNIHHSCSTNVSIMNSLSSRPKRIRKRKRLYIEESESIVRPKRIRRKRPQPPPQIPMPILTDAEIEQQFGERLSPVIKSEHDDELQQIIVETESVPQTPIEKARAKLINALERGHGPDTYLLKIRSRESKTIEIELAIYGTADWHSYRSKILSKIEEALRGLRVSWTKIDIRVDDFDVQICTSPQAASLNPPSSITNMNSSWFLKVLSESGPLIVHIHDRRRPQQRKFIKCSCPQCSPSTETSLPMIVSVSPAKPSLSHRLSSPTILRKTSSSSSSSISSLYNIHTKFFKELIHKYGTNTISSVTQCVLDLTLIVSVHSSLSNLSESNNDYEMKYQQIIDPLKYTENFIRTKSSNESDILTFYRLIKHNRANIRNAQCKTMKNIICKIPEHRPPILINKRQRNPMSTNEHVKAHFTPIIELKPILNGSTTIEQTNNTESIRKITKIISTNTIQKDSQRINTITTQEITPRVIRLLTSNSIRLVTPTTSKQINIVKPLSSITSTIKLANPILISNKISQPSIK